MSAFRTIGDALLSSAGRHTGLYQYLDAADEDLAHFHEHENVHDSIFYRTADGILNLIIVHIAHDDASEFQEIARRNNRLLIRNTTWSHECAATYLGIKSLPTRKQRRRAYESRALNIKAITRSMLIFLMQRSIQLIASMR